MTQNKSKLISKIFLLFVFSLSIQTFGQETNNLISTEEAIKESVKLAPCSNGKRLEAVKKLFVSAGAKDDEITIEKFDDDKISNLVVRKKGKTDETVIIGAHYDLVDEGCGAIDNWTGIAIIAHIYKTLKQIETQKSYIFVAFDKEEKGLHGSAAMVKAIPEEKRAAYCAMLNFDSFGFSAPWALKNVSSPKMIAFAEKLAEESKFKFVDVMLPASSDSVPFKNQGIPAITFSGLNTVGLGYLHTKFDQVGKISMKSVYFSYRFGLVVVSRVDSSGCREFR